MLIPRGACSERLIKPPLLNIVQKKSAFSSMQPTDGLFALAAKRDDALWLEEREESGNGKWRTFAHAQIDRVRSAHFVT